MKKIKIRQNVHLSRESNLILTELTEKDFTDEFNALLIEDQIYKVYYDKDGTSLTGEDKQGNLYHNITKKIVITT